MFEFPEENYKYVDYIDKSTGRHVVLALSTYCGRTVKGSAVCSLDDTFDLAVGKSLAAKRCALKVARLRKSRATRKYLEAVKTVTEAQRHLKKMSQYFMDSVDALDNACDALATDEDR